MQDIQRLPPLPDARIAPTTALFKIDQQTKRLLPWHHQIYNTLEHEDQVLDLPVTLFRILLRRVQV